MKINPDMLPMGVNVLMAKLVRIEAKLKALDADFKKRKLSARVEKLEKVVNKKHPGKNK